MKLSLITIKRRPDSEDVSRRENILEGEELRVGRGSDVDVNLPDVNIAYHHATISATDEGLILSAVGGHSLMVSEQPMEAVVMTPGVTARIGSYELTAEDAPDHSDFAIALAKTDVDTSQKAERPQRLVETMPSRRTLSWVLAILVLGVFLAWPLSSILTRTAQDPNEIRVTGMSAVSQTEQRASANPIETAWKSGPMSRVHATLGDDCASCHVNPFEQTTNNSCLSCHAEVSQHASVADHPNMAGENFRCGSCHKEHVGGERPIETASLQCTSCHADLPKVTSGSDLLNVSDFDEGHPQFRPTVVTGVDRVETGELIAATMRAPLDAQYPMVEQAGLKFSHAQHMVEGGLRGMGKNSGKVVEMECSTCHEPQADGRLYRPIEQEVDCAGCHTLAFRPSNANVLRELPHAKPWQVSEIIHDYYRARVLEGGVQVEGAPDSARRRPGVELSTEGEEEALSWASDQAERELKVIFEVALCGTCHVAGAEEDLDERGRKVWYVEPALINRDWMPKADFNHGPHFAMDCNGCHAASTSTKAEDVLMPQIETCRGCHLGEAAGAASASSECLSCHEFHIESYGPMSEPHSDAMKARRKAAEAGPPRTNATQ